MQSKARSVVQHDDGRVRITRWDLNPGTETGIHRHEFNYVVVPLRTASMVVVSEDGAEQTMDLQTGESYCRDAGIQHNVRCDGPPPVSFVEVEICEYTSEN